MKVSELDLAFERFRRQAEVEAHQADIEADREARQRSIQSFLLYIRPTSAWRLEYDGQVLPPRYETPGAVLRSLKGMVLNDHLVRAVSPRGHRLDLLALAALISHRQAEAA